MYCQIRQHQWLNQDSWSKNQTRELLSANLHFLHLLLTTSQATFRVHVSRADGQLLWWMCLPQLSLEMVGWSKITNATSSVTYSVGVVATNSYPNAIFGLRIFSILDLFVNWGKQCIDKIWMAFDCLEPGLWKARHQIRASLFRGFSKARLISGFSV